MRARLESIESATTTILLIMGGTHHRKLIYIMNRVDPDDSQHFVPVLRGLCALTQLGWDVVVLSEKGGQGEREILGCQVLYLSDKSNRKRIINLFRQLRRLKREGFRIILVRISLPAALMSAIASLINHQMLLFWVSGTVLDFDRETSLGKHRVKMAALKAVLFRAKYLLTGPETMVKYYCNELRISRNKVRLLYNDVDLSTFRADIQKSSSPWITLLIVHRLSAVRETDRYLPAILDSMAELQRLGYPTKLKVFGDGPERPILTELCSKHPIGEHVQFFGAIANAQTPSVYRQADIFLLPSFREGFPRVLIEAMASGLPIVSTDAGGIQDILDTQQRQFISARTDSATFGRNVVTLALRPDIRRKLRDENLERVKRFGIVPVAVMLQDILADALVEPEKR